MLKKEMQLLNSLTLEVAEKEKVDAIDTLAVDRERFSKELTKNYVLKQFKFKDILFIIKNMKYM